MAKPVTHFSRIRQIGRATFCNQPIEVAGKFPEYQCTDAPSEVTCKRCRRELAVSA